MAKKLKKEKVEIKNDDTKLFAFLATFLSIVGFIIFLVSDKKNNNYVKYYAKQSLVVFIACITAGAINWIFLFIPILSWIIRGVLGLIVLVLWVISWVYALSGEMKPLPFLQQYADKINL